MRDATGAPQATRPGDGPLRGVPPSVSPSPVSPTRQIARDAFEPAYSQLAGILRARIAEGEFRAGDRLPTESELSQTYGLSPMTVRRAIKILLDEQAVSTVPGRGTFVEAANIAAATFDLGSIRALLADPGVRVKILAVRIVPASGRVCETLAVPAGTRVIMIRRLLLRDAQPLLYQRQWLIYDPRRPVIETELGVTALRDLFEGRRSVGPKRGRFILHASTLRTEEARWLDAGIGEAAFVLEHLFFGFDDQPLSWGLFVSRPDQLHFEATVGFDPAWAATGTQAARASGEGR